MAQQREHALRDQIGGRLVTRLEEQDRRRGDVVIGELGRFALHRKKPREKIVLRRDSPDRDQLLHVVDEGHRRLVPELLPLGIQGLRRVRPAREGRRPARDARHVVDRRAEHPTDHRDRQRECEFRDEIHLATLLDLIEERIDEGLDLGSELLDRARGEAAIHEGAHAVMLLRSLEREHPPHDVDERASSPHARETEESLVLDEGRAPDEGRRVGVPRDDPGVSEAFDGRAPDGCYGAQLIVESRKRVAPSIDGEDPIEDQRRVPRQVRMGEHRDRASPIRPRGVKRSFSR